MIVQDVEPNILHGVAQFRRDDIAGIRVACEVVADIDYRNEIRL